MDCVQIKNACTLKDTLKRMEKEAINRENYSQSIKKLYSEYIKNSQNLWIRKNSIKSLDRTLHKRIVYRWQISTWKVAQCHYVLTKTHSWMFIRTLVALAKSWKQQNYLSSGEWINKLWRNWYNRVLRAV